MAEPQRFEGTSVEEVLAEVRAALGPDAAIVEANKIRSGGIGGFFAKESVEVLAIPAPAGGGTTDLPPGIDPAIFDRAAEGIVVAGAEDELPLTLADLADRVSDAEQQVSGHDDTATTTAGEIHASTAAHAPASPPAAPGTAGQPRSRAEAVAQQAMHEHLRRATAGRSDDATATPAGGIADGGTPARRAAQDVAQAYHAVESANGFEPLAAEELPRLSTEGAAFTEVLHRIAADAGPEASQALDHRIAAAMAAHTPVPDATPAPVAAFEPPTAPVPPAVPALPDRPDAPPAVPPAAQVEVHLDRTARLLTWLERDNLPRTTLMTALRGLPQLPTLPETTGLVVAVVGERREALRLCRVLAKACDADPADVILASRTYTGTAFDQSQRIIDVTDATRERLSWRRRARPTFVAVECPTAVRGDVHGWTRDVVDALEAHQVIGVVSAGRKVEDVARWVELVGGVDGLALRGLAETSTPYAVLALEIPVAYLDEVIATASAWAQALLEEAPA